MRLPVIFAAMLRERWVCLGLIITGVILVGANALGIPLWHCTFHSVTGLPCPGCGVTRGMTALLRGRLQEAWHWHPFTPLLAIGGLLLLACGVLPQSPRGKVIAAVAWIEQRTGITLIAIASIMLYGFWRMLAYPQWP